MNPATLLEHIDSGQLWTSAPSDAPGFDTAAAYRAALAVRALRIARGEVPVGYKIGFTNRTIWERYGVFAPIWGTVWDTTVTYCGEQGGDQGGEGGEGTVLLARTSQPRLEPEAVFGMAATPPPNATLEQLMQAIAWVAPGFEIVQSHLPGWKFRAADTMADSGLHARLLVGRKRPLHEVAANAAELDTRLGACTVKLLRGDTVMEEGKGANVLDSPLRALHHFLAELRACPGAPDLKAGDIITTGTWTDAWPVEPGQSWTGDFAEPLSRLTVEFK